MPQLLLPAIIQGLKAAIRHSWEEVASDWTKQKICRLMLYSHLSAASAAVPCCSPPVQQHHPTACMWSKEAASHALHVCVDTEVAVGEMQSVW
jgi:hypothetical protein